MYADESINTLRYAERTRSITNSVKQNVLDAILTPAQCAALQAENKILKARIANLTRRSAVNELSVFGSRGMEFSGIEAKLQRAQEEAKATRDSCSAVSSTADRLRERYKKFAGKVEAVSHLVYRPPCTPVATYCTVANTFTLLLEQSANQSRDQCELFVEEGVAHRIYCLVQEKIALCDELVALSRQMESKRLELDFNDSNFDLYPSELRQEVSNMQEKIQLLARSMKENEASLQSLLGSVSGEQYPHDINAQTEHLQDERAHRHELEIRCESLGQDIDFVNSENDILRHQNKRLQDEIQRLRTKLGSSEAQVDPERREDEEEADSDSENHEERTSSSEHRMIRSHAEQLLDWADRAIGKGQNAPENACENSMASSLATDLRPSLRHQGCANFRSRSNVAERENQFLISNMNSVERAAACPCQESPLFSSNPEHVDFYLPKLGIMCSCGRKQEVPLQGLDPCHLVNILRDWQVEFLNSIGIQTAADLVLACAQSSKPLAKEMRQWRKEKGMLSVRTKSCCIALRVWSRTCKAVMKAVQEGVPGRPDFLDVSLASDSFSVSTLGFCGSTTDARHFSNLEEALI
jgi:hypothetical protein